MTERYDRFWAEYLGITPAELNQPGPSIAAHVGLEGYRGVWSPSKLGVVRHWELTGVR